MTWLVVLLSLAADLALFALRCPASPPISIIGLATALFAQGGSVLLVHWGTVDAQEQLSQLFRQPMLRYGLVLFLVSLPLARVALNYSDAIGKPKGYRSIGQQCSIPRQTPSPAPARS